MRVHQSLLLYPRAPPDDRGDVIQLEFAGTTALSNVNAIERR